MHEDMNKVDEQIWRNYSDPSQKVSIHEELNAYSLNELFLRQEYSEWIMKENAPLCFREAYVHFVVWKQFTLGPDWNNFHSVSERLSA